MKRSLIKRGLQAGAALGAAAGLMSFAMPAHAAPTDVNVIAVGSDTTQGVMKEAFAYLEGQAGKPANTHFFSVDAFFSGTQAVPSGTHCGALNWVQDTIPPTNNPPIDGVAPQGSSAGRNYLNINNTASRISSNTNGCASVARSSGGPRSGAVNGTNGKDGTGFEYYAFALDAVSWASASLKAPSNLTVAQLQGIYSCAITDWSQVGGIAGPIKRYLPNVGSGTRDFFLQRVLGYGSGKAPPDSGQTANGVGVPPGVDGTGAVAPGTAVCADSVTTGEENNGTIVSDANFDKAILPYSVGQWNTQFNNRSNPSLDKRKQATLRGLKYNNATQTGIPTRWNSTNRAYQQDSGAGGVVHEDNVPDNTSYNATTSYPGVRYVYNVLDSNGPSDQYAAGKTALGFTNTLGGTVSDWCKGITDPGSDAQNLAAIINSYGFANLDTSNTHNQNAASLGNPATNNALSACRKLSAF